MFVSLLRSVAKLTARNRRYCACWCPEEPLDPNTRITYLHNGVRVMTEQNNSPLTCVSLFVVVGPRYETANSNGITHFIEHLAYKGFCSMNKSCLECKISTAGARLLAKTQRDMQIFSILIPSQSAADAVVYLSKIILELALDVKELDKSRYTMCLHALEADENTRQNLFHFLHAAAFQGTSLAQPVIGPLRNIAKFDQCFTSSFLSEHYTTCRLVVAASGGVYHEQILGAAAGTFGCLCPCGDWDAEAGPQRFTGSQVVYRDDSMSSCHVAFAFEVPGYNTNEYFTFLVMKYIIGLWHKSQGRSENQPFYCARGASSFKCKSYKTFYIPYKDVGLWGVKFSVDPFHVDNMVRHIQHVCMEMSIMYSSVEITQAKNMTKMEVAKRYYGVLNSCRDMGIQMLYACRRYSLRTMLDRVDAVQPSMVKNMCMKYLYGQNPVVAAIGATEDMPPYNRFLDGTYWLRW